ncbi:MAG: CBS domain-containing protein [Candidatus Nomurabacteria bacterium]|jgi:CBS domain containing-hemolysin-like protein|nr:CBS domain-containing protein [Candidatus Nomurabacteria bacterium]
MIVVLLILYAVAVFLAAVRPTRSILSEYELERRAKTGDAQAKKAIFREKLLPSVLVLRDFLVLLAILGFAVVAYFTYGFMLAIFITALAAITLAVVRNIRTWSNLATSLYRHIEPELLNFVKYLHVVLRFFANVKDDFINPTIGSKEELMRLVETASDGVVAPEEKSLLVGALQFSEYRASDIMTPIEDAIMLKASTELTPTKIDELSRTHYRRFPVFDKTEDNIVGVLNLRRLTSLSVKETLTAREAMRPKVYFARTDNSLDDILAIFARTNTFMLVVIDRHKKPRGILTVSDIFERLLGRPLSDDFEFDADPDAVATRIK